MNKLIVSLGFVFFSVFVSNAFAMAKDEEWKGWRSTETRSAETDVLVSTGIVYIYKIVVTSGASGANDGYATFRYFNSSTTVAGGVSRTSSTIYDIDTTANEFEIRDVLSRGFRYTKTGDSSIKVLWDFISPPVNSNRERIGLK